MSRLLVDVVLYDLTEMFCCGPSGRRWKNLVPDERR